MIQDNGYLRLT